MNIKYLLLPALVATCCSCASLLNKRQKNVTIYTTAPTRIIHENDTLYTRHNKATLRVRRAKTALQIRLKNDSLQQTIHIPAKNSFAWYANFCNYGLGMLFDKNKAKRYTYPGSIYFFPELPKRAYYTYPALHQRGEMQLHFGLPHVNFFSLVPQQEARQSNGGFWGLALGMDYYHSPTRFVSLKAGAASDFFIPFPAAVDLIGTHEFMYSYSLSVSDNYHWRKFSLGYGLSFTQNTWEVRYYDRFDPPPPTREPVSKTHIACGLIFPFYYHAGKKFHLGLNYRPTFYRPNLPDKFEYEHLLSLELAWRIPVRRS